MFNQKKHPPMRNAIGAGMQVQGPCTFEDGLQIDGTVLGDVLPASEQSVSKIVIGPTGQVQGTIRADFIVIAGTVIGNVQALEALELQASAHVQSEAIQYRTLEMQTGAVISGQLQPQLMPPSTPAKTILTSEDQAV
jgi:hypothetical protein